MGGGNVSTWHVHNETSSKDGGNEFPDDAENDKFPDENDEGDEREKGISWKDLPNNTWYRIEVKKDLTSFYGPTKLLTLSVWRTLKP